MDMSQFIENETPLKEIFDHTGFRLFEKMPGLTRAVYRNPLSPKKGKQIVISVYSDDVLGVTFYPSALKDAEEFLVRFKDWLKFARKVECRVSWDVNDLGQMTSKTTKIANRLKPCLYPYGFFMEPFVPDLNSDKMYLDFIKDEPERKVEDEDNIWTV